MLMKWFLFFAIAYIAYRYWSRTAASRERIQPSMPTEKMLACAQCNVRFPEGEAVLREGNVFCSEKHSALWKQNH